MPSCLHYIEMLAASGRSVLYSMIFRRIDADNVFGTSHYQKAVVEPRPANTLATHQRCHKRSHTYSPGWRRPQALLANAFALFCPDTSSCRPDL